MSGSCCRMTGLLAPGESALGDAVAGAGLPNSSAQLPVLTQSAAGQLKDGSLHEMLHSTKPRPPEMPLPDLR
eukprot:7386787-Prymnesium_polylepis.1